MNNLDLEPANKDDVLRLVDIDEASVAALLATFGLSLKTIANGTAIPGSFWGDDEAGLVANDLLARPDTPLHSILHEACHYICMDRSRRAGLDTDAGGDYDEENAVCYLQVLLAACVEGFGRARMFADMDRWGYTFRLGSAQAWFEQDAVDALAWLQQYGLLDQQGRPTWKLRED